MNLNLIWLLLSSGFVAATPETVRRDGASTVNGDAGAESRRGLRQSQDAATNEFLKELEENILFNDNAILDLHEPTSPMLEGFGLGSLWGRKKKKGKNAKKKKTNKKKKKKKKKKKPNQGPKLTSQPTSRPSQNTPSSSNTTNIPSTVPSPNPSETPSDQPSNTPSASLIPSSMPSIMPSYSSQPSLRPSKKETPAPNGSDPTVEVAVKALFVSSQQSSSQERQTAGLLDNAEAIANVMGATVVPGSIELPGLYGTRPVVEMSFLVNLLRDLSLETLVGNDTLRDALVISLEEGDTAVNVSSCAGTCGYAELDVPPGYCYPPTDECICTAGYGGSNCEVLCASATTEPVCNGHSGCGWCNTTTTCLTTESLARTAEEVDSCSSCEDFDGQGRFCDAAPLCVYCASTGTCTSIENTNVTCPFDVISTSPLDGEADVALTRETVITFSEPVHPASISPSNVMVAASSKGNLNATRHLSASGKLLTIFYDDVLPANADVVLRISNSLMSLEGNPLSSNYEFFFSTLSVLPVAETLVCGRVFASEQNQDVVGDFLDVPLEGVTVSIDGNEDVKALTLEDGSFVLGPVPAGKFFVHIDGRTSTRGVSNGSYYPNVGKAWTTVAGQMKDVGTIHLPLVSNNTLKPLNTNETTTIEFPEEVTNNNPALEGVFLSVPPGSLIDSSGNSPEDGMVGIAPVDRDRLPGTLPPTLRLPLVITIQTMGGANFDEPVPVCFPNLPDPITNNTLTPGETSSLWSFDHDKGRFEVVGPATVDADGTLVCSDAGYGILAPGWHGAAPGTPTDGPEDEPECEGDPCCNSDDPCCGSEGGGGGGGDGGGGNGEGSWGKAAKTLGDSLFGCAKDALGKLLPNWKKAINCGSSLYGLANNLYDAFKDRPKNTQDIVDRVSSTSGGKWGVIRDCTDTLSSFIPVSRAFKMGMAAYKCARGLQKSFGEMCKAGNWGANDECGKLDDICRGNDAISDALGKVDTFLNLLDGFGLNFDVPSRKRLARLLAELPPAVTDDEIDDILIDYFFDSQEQYDRLTLDGIILQMDAIISSIDDGLTEDEIFEMADVLIRDMEVLSNMTGVMLNINDAMEDLNNAYEETWSSITSYATEAASSSGESVGKRRLWIYISTEDGDEFRIQTTDAGEIVGFVLAPTVAYTCFAYDAEANAFAWANGITSPNGIRTVLPSLTFFSAKDFPDTDGDGLCDVCEQIIGTNHELQDSDSDGTGDRQEILSGSNPLDGLALSTGVVGNFPLAGGDSNVPVVVATSGAKIYVAMSNGGIACYNAFNALQPTLTNVIGQGHQFTDISVREIAVLGLTSSGDVIFLSGTDYSSVLDVTSQFPELEANTPASVYLGDEHALVGTSYGAVFAFPSDFSFQAQTVRLGTVYDVDSVALTPYGSLVALAGPKLYFFLPDLTRRQLWEEDANTVSSARFSSRTLNVGTSRIYVATSGRLEVFSAWTGVSLGSGAGMAVPMLDFVALDSNGGTAIALTNNQVQVWNVDDTSGPEFRAGFAVDSATRRDVMAAANGFLYIGASNALSIVNVVNPDTAGSPPTVTNVQVLLGSTELLDGSNVEEGRVLRLVAEVSDDVIVRQVLFSANGASEQRLDSTFPYSASIEVPHIASAQDSTQNITVTAWDAAGNMASSFTRSFNVITDIQPPFVNLARPEPNGTAVMRVTSDLQVAQDLALSFFFSEPVMLAPDAKSLIHAQRNGTAVDLSNITIAFSSVLNHMEIVIPYQSLVLGSYEVGIMAGFVSDAAGNPSNSTSWSFHLLSNQIFLNEAVTCQPTAQTPYRYQYTPAEESNLSWQAISLTVFPYPQGLTVRIFKGPDETYPQVHSDNCYYNYLYRVYSWSDAFVVTNSNSSTYSIELTSVSLNPMDVNVVLSGPGSDQVVLGEATAGVLRSDGQIPRHLLKNSQLNRELVINKSPNFSLELVPSNGKEDRIRLYHNYEHDQITLKYATDYYLYVMPTRYASSCDTSTYFNNIGLEGIEYTFRISEPKGMSGPTLSFGETGVCDMNDYGDWCDFSFSVSQAQRGLPLSFHLLAETTGFFSSYYRYSAIEILYQGGVVFSDVCQSDEMHVLADFIPEHTGIYTMRVKDWYSRSIGQINATLGNDPSQTQDLPLNTLAISNWTYVADVGWYEVDVSSGDELVISLHSTADSIQRGGIKVFSGSGRRLLHQASYYSANVPAIHDLQIDVDGPIRIAFAPSLTSCTYNTNNFSWENSVGKEYSLAVWKKHSKAPSTNLTSVPSLAYGGSTTCAIDRLGDFCQFRLHVSADQAGWPLFFYVHDIATSDGFPAIRPQVRVLREGKEEVNTWCYGNQELANFGEYTPQFVGDVELLIGVYQSNSVGNMTLSIGADQSLSAVELNTAADRHDNFTMLLHERYGTEGTPLLYTFLANAGDEISASWEAGVSYPRLSLIEVPSGAFILRDAYTQIQPFVIEHSSTYTLLVTPYRVRSCRAPGYWETVAGQQVNVTVSKMNDGDSTTPQLFPVPQDVLSESLLDTLRLSCDIGAAELNSCAYLIDVSEEEAGTPMNLFMRRPASDLYYRAQFEVFYNDSYAAQESWSFTTCTSRYEYYGFSIGDFVFPRAGSYVLYTSASQNISGTIDFSFGANIKDENTESVIRLEDGDTLSGTFTIEKPWYSFEVEVPEPDIFLTVDIINGTEMRLWLIYPDGVTKFQSSISYYQPALNALIEMPGTYTVMVSPFFETTCYQTYYWEENFNTSFTALLHLDAATQPIEILQTVEIGDAIDCEITQAFGKCTYRIEVSADQVGIPFTVFPELVLLPSHSGGFNEYWSTRVKVSEDLDYPAYALFDESTCYTSVYGGYDPNFYTQAWLGSLVFFNEGTHVIEISNGEGRRLTGHVRVTISPSSFEEVSSFPQQVTDEPLFLEGTFSPVGHVKNYLLLNVQQDISIQLLNGIGTISLVVPDDDFVSNRLRRLTDTSPTDAEKTDVTDSIKEEDGNEQDARKLYTATNNDYLELNVPDGHDAVDAILIISPADGYCRYQDSSDWWLTNAGANFSVQITKSEEYPSLPLPVISVGDEFNCTIHNPSMFCAYEFVATDADVNKVLPIYFDEVALDAPSSNSYWQTEVYIASADEYPDSYSFIDSTWYSTTAWYTFGYMIPRPGRYVVRMGNGHNNRGSRATGTVRVHFGMGQRQSLSSEVSPYNTELFVSGSSFVDSFTFEARKGDFVAVEIRSTDTRWARIYDCEGNFVDYASYGDVQYEVEQSGLHQVVLGPYNNYYDWESGSTEPYSLIIWQANPKPIEDRITLTENGLFDFECTIDRLWSFCGFVLDVGEDQVGNSLSVVTSNIRNITEHYNLENEWRTVVLVDEGDYEGGYEYEWSPCYDDSSARFFHVLTPYTAGRYTIRVGNSENYNALGAFEVGFSNFWRPRQTLVEGETVSFNSTRWADVHSFRVNATGDTYDLLVETEDENSAFSLSTKADREYSYEYENRATGSLTIRIYPDYSGDDVLVEVSPMATDSYCDEEIDQIVGVRISVGFNVTLLPVS